MPAFYHNLQRFDLSSRFSVRQRRFGWELLVHPKKHFTSRGEKHQIVRTLPLDNATVDQLDKLREFYADSFQEAARAMHEIANEKLRRATA